MGDQEALSNVQRELGCDILLSISGAFSYSMPDPTPSFVLMVLQGEEAIVYLYVLNDKKEKFEVNKLEFSKNAGDFKKAEEEEEGKKKEKKNRMYRMSHRALSSLKKGLL